MPYLLDFQTEILHAAQTLAQGGVVAVPTDTLYGLAADALNPDGLERVYAAKGRPADMPLPVLVSGWEQSRQVAAVSAVDELLARRLVETYWPGPLTMVLPAAPGLPDRLTAGTRYGRRAYARPSGSSRPCRRPGSPHHRYQRQPQRRA